MCSAQGSFNPSGSEEADSDFDPEAGEGASGAVRKRKSTGRRRSAGKSAKRGRKKGAKPKVPTVRNYHTIGTSQNIWSLRIKKEMILLEIRWYIECGFQLSITSLEI